MTNSHDCRQQFSHFYANHAIDILGSACRWTISGQIGDLESESTEAKQPTRKAPIDVRHLIDTMSPSGCRCIGACSALRGAWTVGAECLVTLDELTAAMPNAANCAYYVRTLIDGFVVIDIEPSCPEEIAADLLRLPGIEYAEVSMSGRGYHLVMPTPANFYDFPLATSKRVVREEHGWYEILLEHWVTFTRKPLPATSIELLGEPREAPLFASVEDLWADLASKAMVSAARQAVAVSVDVDASEIPGAAQIVERTVTGAQPRLKRLDDFDGDQSRWEFSILGTLYREMVKHLIRVGFVNRITYTDGDRAHLLHMAAAQVLPSRPKHREQRNGRPFLLDRAVAMVSISLAA